MKNKIVIITLVIALLAVALYFALSGRSKIDSKIETLHPQIGDVEVKVTATGTVKPQNRLEIKPPINGRIEKIFMTEGQKVKKGQVLALMSSTDRAALLDAAHSQGKEAVEYWEKVYLPTPLIAPINGEVIVRAVEPGQTISSSDAVLVLSDRLIVQAQIDETDIGKIKNGLEAEIILDAYPEVTIKSRVDHISYESTVTNNVTIYEVDILPDNTPDFYRSGMSAQVKILEQKKTNVLLIPMEAVVYDGNKSYVIIKDDKKDKTEKIAVELGLNNESMIEVISGLNKTDQVVFSGNGKIIKNQGSQKSNPFMPFGGRPRTKKN